jgi:hypothetical protein
VHRASVGAACGTGRQYLSSYVLRPDAVAAHLDMLGVGSWCIRYRRAQDLDADVVRSILQMTAATEGPGC